MRDEPISSFQMAPEGDLEEKFRGDVEAAGKRNFEKEGNDEEELKTGPSPTRSG